MPFGDGTGPQGAGPMTGRAAGFCAGYNMPGYANPIGFRRGGGAGIGRGGRGRRNWFYATGMPGWQRAAAGYPAWGGFAPPHVPYTRTMTAEQELADLNDQIEYYEKVVENLRKQITKLESEQSTD